MNKYGSTAVFGNYIAALSIIPGEKEYHQTDKGVEKKTNYRKLQLNVFYVLFIKSMLPYYIPHDH